MRVTNPTQGRWRRIGCAMSTHNQSGAAWRANRIAVVGAGVMGTSLAATVGRVAPVVMVCRNPDAAEAIRSGGVRTTGVLMAESRPQVVREVRELADIGGVSVVFVATKTGAIADVAAALRPVLGQIGDQPGAPFIVSYQNGIEPGRQLIEMLDDPRVLRMVLTFGGVQQSPGCVEVKFNRPPHHIGCLEPAHEVVCRHLAELLSAGGLETQFDRQIERRVWTKGIINAAMNPVAALVDSTIGQVLDSPARIIVRRLLEEGLAVARAEGISIDPVEDGLPSRREGGVAFLDYAMAVLEQGRQHTPSMVEDIRAGHISEVGQLNLQVVRHGRKVGVATPTHETILALIETFDWKTYRREHASERAANDARMSSAARDGTSRGGRTGLAGSFKAIRE